MIDSSELRAIRQRYETAQKAANAVVATLDDVKRAGYLDTLAQALRRAAEMAKAGEPVDERNLAEVVIQAVDNTYDRISQWEQTGEESAW